MSYLKREQDRIDADIALLRKVIDDWIVKAPPRRSDAYSALNRLAYAIGASEDPRVGAAQPEASTAGGPRGQREEPVVETATTRESRPHQSGWDSLSEDEKDEWERMAEEMRDPAVGTCSCGFPGKPCLRMVLRNGPPYPPRPCEPIGPERGVQP